VEALHDQEQRLHLAFPPQQVLDGLQHTLAPLWGIEGLPLWVLNRHV
jgi:hypothetical protein